MSYNKTSGTEGDVARDGETLKRLEDKMEGLNLHNTEDVDQTTNYARRKLSNVTLVTLHGDD
jgi:hypothetical protein